MRALWFVQMSATILVCVLMLSFQPSSYKRKFEENDAINFLSFAQEFSVKVENSKKHVTRLGILVLENQGIEIDLERADCI